MGHSAALKAEASVVISVGMRRPLEIDTDETIRHIAADASSVVISVGIRTHWKLLQMGHCATFSNARILHIIGIYFSWERSGCIELPTGNE
jgi:hypothetical protein